jgi:hypothetical protein
MASRSTLVAELRSRLGEAADDVWETTELKGFVNFAIKALYPYFFQYKVDTTTAGAGPIQTAPTGARNLYSIGVVRDGATRVRPIRGWTEGDAEANVPKLGITDQVLVWSWTEGWDAPSTDSETLTIPKEAEEVVVIRAHITALEKVITSRSKTQLYLAVQVREGASEQDILDTLDALHASLKEHLDRGMQLPQAVR